MKNYIILFMAMTMSLGLMSQDRKDEKREQIESKRVAYITERAALTAQESEAYWPLSKELRDKKEAKRDGMKKKDFDFEHASDAEIEARLRAGAQNQVEAEKLELEYLDRFIKVLGARKYATVLKAEKDFRREMLREFRDSPRPDRPERPSGSLPK